MTEAARRGSANGFLPLGTGALFRRVGWQIGGVLLVGLSAALAVSLASFDALDPSWNTASMPGRPLHNLLGLAGSYAADLLLQMLGAVAWLPVLTLAAWGIRMAAQGLPPARFWIGAAVLAMPLLAVALAMLPGPLPPALAGFARGMGGAGGSLLLDGLSESLRLAGLSSLVWLLAGVSGLLGALCAMAGLGVSWGEGRAAVHLLAASRRRLFARPGGAGSIDETASVGPGMVPAPRARGRMPAPRVEPRFEPQVTPRAPSGEPGRREAEQSQGQLDLADHVYELPPLRLLTPPPEQHGPLVDDDSLKQNARLLVSVLDDFGVNGKITTVRPGPVVTLYELEPAPGTKTSRVIGLSDDIARSMSALSVRIATVPGRSVIGIELPNHRRETVYLRELLAAQSFERSGMALTLVLGKDIGGQAVMVDLARMPHLLIAGTTGSGKSVAINTMILSLLYRLRPDQCRLIMIDPKMLELSVYDGIPHLLAPVVTDPGRAVVALKWAVREMEDRYRAMSQLGVRNIAGYNQRLAEARAKGETLTRTVQTGFDSDSGKPIYEDQQLALEPLPYIVVVVDEMADLMLVAGKDIEAAVQRLAQMARAAGIHLIMATQRPSVDVITGTIKANFPSRISFQVSSKIDSRTILGEQGAEQLLGQGDMLYMAAGGRITRVHGPFVSDQEVESVVEHLRNQGEPTYLEAVTTEDETAIETAGDASGSGDALYDQAIALVAREGKASTSFVQRHLQIGYNRAARIIERMEAEGVVGRANHVGKREVLLRRSDEE